MDLALIRRLRRFATALSGAVALGDLCIEECLRRAGDGRDVPFDCWTELKAYASVTRQIRAWFGDAAPSTMAASGDAALAEALRTLDFDLRACVVLSLLEGFEPAQIAAIVGCSPAEARRRIDSGRRRIDCGTGVTVLIIEDNVLTARTLTDTVTGFGHTVVGIARGQDDALRIAKSAEPRLVLADVKLLDGGSGIRAAHGILETVASRVVIVTGHPEMIDESARSAFSVVVKPFAPAALQRAIRQALAA